MTETRDPGDIENDDIAPDEDDTSDTSADTSANSVDQPPTDEADVSVPDAEAEEEGETDAPIGHPDGYVAPENDPAPIYNPDAEEG